jgi:hypothetical protein
MTEGDVICTALFHLRNISIDLLRKILLFLPCLTNIGFAGPLPVPGPLPSAAVQTSAAVRPEVQPAATQTQETAQAAGSPPDGYKYCWMENGVEKCCWNQGYGNQVPCPLSSMVFMPGLLPFVLRSQAKQLQNQQYLVLDIYLVYNNGLQNF